MSSNTDLVSPAERVKQQHNVHLQLALYNVDDHLQTAAGGWATFADGVVQRAQCAFAETGWKLTPDEPTDDAQYLTLTHSPEIADVPNTIAHLRKSLIALSDKTGMMLIDCVATDASGVSADTLPGMITPQEAQQRWSESPIEIWTNNPTEKRRYLSALSAQIDINALALSRIIWTKDQLESALLSESDADQRSMIAAQIELCKQSIDVHTVNSNALKKNITETHRWMQIAALTPGASGPILNAQANPSGAIPLFDLSEANLAQRVSAALQKLPIMFTGPAYDGLVDATTQIVADVVGELRIPLALSADALRRQTEMLNQTKATIARREERGVSSDADLRQQLVDMGALHTSALETIAQLKNMPLAQMKKESAEKAAALEKQAKEMALRLKQQQAAEMTEIAAQSLLDAAASEDLEGVLTALQVDVIPIIQDMCTQYHGQDAAALVHGLSESLKDERFDAGNSYKLGIEEISLSEGGEVVGTLSLSLGSAINPIACVGIKKLDARACFDHKKIIKINDLPLTNGVHTMEIVAPILSAVLAAKKLQDQKANTAGDVVVEEDDTVVVLAPRKFRHYGDLLQRIIAGELSNLYPERVVTSENYAEMLIAYELAATEARELVLILRNIQKIDERMIAYALKDIFCLEDARNAISKMKDWHFFELDNASSLSCAPELTNHQAVADLFQSFYRTDAIKVECESTPYIQISDKQSGDKFTLRVERQGRSFLVRVVSPNTAADYWTDDIKGILIGKLRLGGECSLNDQEDIFFSAKIDASDKALIAHKNDIINQDPERYKVRETNNPNVIILTVCNGNNFSEHTVHSYQFDNSNAEGRVQAMKPQSSHLYISESDYSFDPELEDNPEGQEAIYHTIFCVIQDALNSADERRRRESGL